MDEGGMRAAAQAPPSDELAEMGVVGSCLLDGAAVNYAADICGPDDFYLDANREIFRVALDLNKDGADIDALTVGCELARRNLLERVGGASYMDRLIDTLPVQGHVEEYARRVAKCAQLRETMLAAGNIIRSCQARRGDEDVEAAVESVRRAWEGAATADAAMTLSVLVDQPRPRATEWLIDGWWLDQGCGLLAAEEKSSKTTLALAMGMCVASGAPWLRRWPVRRGPVLALFEEDHERTVRRRAELLGRAMGVDPHLDDFHVLCQTGITIGGQRSRGRGRLAALIRRYRPALTILDPLRRMTPGVDENDSRAVSDYLGWLRRQQKENGTAIICLHHFAKEARDGRERHAGHPRRITHRVRGSSDFLAWYDSLVLVERETETRHRVNALHRGAGRLPETTVFVEWQDDRDAIDLHWVQQPVARPEPREPGQREAF